MRLLVQIAAAAALSQVVVAALDVPIAHHNFFKISAEHKRNSAFQKQQAFVFQPNLNLSGGDGIQIWPNMEKFGFLDFEITKWSAPALPHALIPLLRRRRRSAAPRPSLRDGSGPGPGPGPGEQSRGPARPPFPGPGVRPGTDSD